MKRLIIILTLLSLPLLIGADWQPKGNINMNLGLTLGGIGTPPAHGDSIVMETSGYILNEGGGTILKE